MTAALNINSANSFAYVIAPNQAFNTILSEIQNSPYELTILGNVSNLTPGLIHSSSMPLANKLVVGYVDVGESTALVTYQYFGNSLPSWFGNVNPGFPNLYTVQYWQPQWLQTIEGQINQQIAAGFDGVFLDVLSAYEEWSPGNIEGNHRSEVRCMNSHDTFPAMINHQFINEINSRLERIRQSAAADHHIDILQGKSFIVQLLHDTVFPENKLIRNRLIYR